MVKKYANHAYKSLTTQPPVTLIISFYKNTRMLDLVLASLINQTYKNFGVIICDDGSPAEIVALVHNQLENLSIPCQHLWHEDIGFRKNRILNWGIQNTTSDYLFFIDQDCILHPEFMREHVEGKKENGVLCGRRINLTHTVSKLLSPKRVVSGFIEKNIWWILLAGLFMKDNNGIKGIYYRNPFLRMWANQKPRGIVGCNFSLHRKNLLDINGFDTRYEGAGFGEDSDIEYRLTLNGVRMIPACNTTVQYHIYHRLLTRASQNEALFDSVIHEKRARTNTGLSEQLNLSPESDSDRCH